MTNTNTAGLVYNQGGGLMAFSIVFFSSFFFFPCSSWGVKGKEDAERCEGEREGIKQRERERERVCQVTEHHETQKHIFKRKQNKINTWPRDWQAWLATCVDPRGEGTPDLLQIPGVNFRGKIAIVVAICLASSSQIKPHNYRPFGETLLWLRGVYEKGCTSVVSE